MLTSFEFDQSKIFNFPILRKNRKPRLMLQIHKIDAIMKITVDMIGNWANVPQRDHFIGALISLGYFYQINISSKIQVLNTPKITNL